jgi:hypothetical protein
VSLLNVAQRGTGWKAELGLISSFLVMRFTGYGWLQIRDFAAVLVN